jgi:predicted site-specific integrase-resolvase
MATYVSTGQAAKMLGVSVSTLQRWDRTGKLVPERTPAGRRRYKVADLGSYNPLTRKVVEPNRKTVAYARVSSHDQKPDLDRQAQVLEMYCAAHGWDHEVVTDLGSGMNYRKKGLTRLLDQVIGGEVGRLVITHKDRLLRFGAELVFAVCAAKHVEVVIINSGDERSFEEELASDVLEIVTVFSARMYGARSHKNKRLIDGVSKAVADAQGA